MAVKEAGCILEYQEEGFARVVVQGSPSLPKEGSPLNRQVLCKYNLSAS